MKITEFKKENLIITADDFAISQGVDETILNLCKIGALNSVSCFTVTKRFEKSAEELKKTNAKIGLHLSLTFGKALTINGKSLITDEYGNFNKSFIQILMLSIFKKKEFQKLIAPEVKAQFEKLKACVLNVSHIDGHQHIHTIPAVFEIVKNLQVPRIRIINEKFLQKHVLNPQNIVGTIKLALLRLLCAFNGKKSDVYFVSIFKTCKIEMNFIQNYKTPKGFEKVEIMLHPGNCDVDANDKSKESGHLKSKWRNAETQFAKDFLGKNV